MITVATNLIVRPPSPTASNLVTKTSSHVPLPLIHGSLFPMQQQQLHSDSKFNNISFMNNNNNEIDYKHHYNNMDIQQHFQHHQGNDFNYSQPHQALEDNNWSERILQDVIGLLHILSPSGKILYCSESCIELTGYHPQELIGKSLTDFLHTDDLDIFAKNFQMAFSTLSRIKVHYRIRRKDNTYLLLESIGQPKQDVPDQPPQSFFAIAQPYLSRSNGLLDSFLELKMENEWLKKRLNDLMFIQQSPPPSANTAATLAVDTTTNKYQQSQYQLQQYPQQYHPNDQQMQYYPQSFLSSTSFDNNNSSNDLLIGTTNDHTQQYFMNNSPQISSRRTSSCNSATMFQRNNNNTMADDNRNNNKNWNNNNTTYSPSVASSAEFNEMLVRYQQEEQMNNTEAGMTSYLSSNNSTMTTNTADTLQQKDKWKRRKKQRGVDDYVCADCGTTASPEWRKGPHGPKTLCNACGLRWAKKNKKI